MKKIKDIPKKDRPREKLLDKGAKAISKKFPADILPLIWANSR